MTREEAIEKLKSLWYFLTNNDYPQKDLDALQVAIKALSSSENPNKWIPVSERLPEDHKDVLIYLSSDQICIGCYNSHRLPFNNNAIGWGASYVHNWCSDDVVAWMPLPESYKAESEDKE